MAKPKLHPESSEIANLAARLEAVLRQAKGADVSAEVLEEKLAGIRGYSTNVLRERIQDLESYVTSGGADLPTSSSGPASFENLSKMKARLGEGGFIEKLISEMQKRPEATKDLISLMAWNDHNSDWYLSRSEIAESMTIDGEPITPEMVAESLSSMVD